VDECKPLDLGNNRLSRDTAEVLADALRKNETLKSMQLVNNPLGYEAGAYTRPLFGST
jgi:Ran GTPase-activating protein (RanGAP) involved in mRNA processing and transport